MTTRRRSQRSPHARGSYDHDAHKREPMEPAAGAMTFLALMCQQAAIDAAMGNDPRERWERAKAVDREQRAEAAKRRGRA
ncbi:MAG: hypothetical protein KIT58_13445 [Planctomycetota bacterium]|nr:hypothetical protein [Planctomycetota bacterium]